jgi:hypothetical protein
LAVGAALLLGANPALAADDATSLDVRAALTDAGLVTVTTTLTFPTGAPDPLTQVFRVAVDQGNGTQLNYTLTNLTATSGETLLGVTTELQSDTETVTIATGGASTVTLSYTVAGATQAMSDDSVRAAWTVLQGLPVGVEAIAGQFDLPSGVRDYLCEAGPAGATTKCGHYSGGLHGLWAMTFEDGPRAAGDVITLTAVLDPGTVPVTANVTERWSLARAFSAGWSRLGAALGVVALGGLVLLLIRRRLRGHAGAKPVRVAEFAVDGDGVRFTVHEQVRPGLVGTLIDQSVDPSDVVATLLDLAVRGHLRITQLEPASAHAAPDWSLTRLPGADRLDAYERQLLDAVAPAGTPTRVSALTSALAPAIGEVQRSLYAQVVAAGWFARPPQGRNKWAALAWLGVALAAIVTVCLALTTTWALVGVAVVAVALLGLLVAQDVPVLTPRGQAVLAGLADLSADLHHAPTALPAGREFAEASGILPYAIVLGGWDRWLASLVAADTDDLADPTDLDWYHAPATWHLTDLPVSLDAFITVVTGRLFTRA